MLRALLVFFVALFASGHDLWLERDGKAFVVRYGHIRPKKGEEALIRYDPDRVLSSLCFNEAGEKVKVKIDGSYPYRIEGDCAVIYVVYSSGYWTKSVDGTKNISKDKTPGAIEGWISYESVKSVQGWSSDLSKPLTDDLEIVPFENPLMVPIGKKMDVMVFYRGKPMKDVVVSYNAQVVGTTDEKGRIRLKVKERGTNLIGATLRERGDGVKADYVLRTTSLQFEVR